MDEKLKVEKIGLVSKNLADKIVEVATENSFRETAEIINKTTNANIFKRFYLKDYILPPNS